MFKRKRQAEVHSIKPTQTKEEMLGPKPDDIDPGPATTWVVVLKHGLPELEVQAHQHTWTGASGNNPSVIDFFTLGVLSARGSSCTAMFKDLLGPAFDYASFDRPLPLPAAAATSFLLKVTSSGTGNPHSQEPLAK